MRWGAIVTVGLGAVIPALGILWFLQGSDLVHIEPILCVANCEPLVGHSPQWQLAGGVAALVGVGLVVASVRRILR